jgi:hypothetical protein
LDGLPEPAGTWLERCAAVRFDGETLVVDAGDRFFVRWCADHYGATVAEAAGCPVRFVSGDLVELDQADRDELERRRGEAAAAAELERRREQEEAAERDRILSNVHDRDSFLEADRVLRKLFKRDPRIWSAYWLEQLDEYLAYALPRFGSGAVVEALAGFLREDRFGESQWAPGAFLSRRKNGEWKVAAHRAELAAGRARSSS